MPNYSNTARSDQFEIYEVEVNGQKSILCNSCYGKK